MNRKAYVKDMVKSFGLAGWTVKFDSDKALRADGYHRDTLGYAEPMTKTIGISASHLKSASDVQFIDTVLHEISHALIFETSPKAYMLPAHGKHWKMMAKLVGAYPAAGGLPE
jgi:hypothetical protein